MIRISNLHRNGIERYRRDLGVFSIMSDNLVPEGRSPLGPDISEQVHACDISVPFDWRSILQKQPISL